MTSPFQRYLNQNYHFNQSCYEHQMLQPRNIKTREKFRSTIDSNFNKKTQPYQQSQTINTNEFMKSNPKTFKSQNSKESPKKNQQGRNLFDHEIAQKSVLGPGDYEPIIKRSHSFGYIQKRSQSQVIPSKRIKETISQYLGPGRYKIQTSQNLLSTHKSLNGVKFNSEKLIRCILSKEKAEKINLILNNDIEKKQAWRLKLGPGFYNLQNSQTKIDKFKKIISFPVSMTARSSLIKNEKLPGPGYYKWSKDMVQNINQKNKKPKIQYQSVH